MMQRDRRRAAGLCRAVLPAVLLTAGLAAAQPSSVELKEEDKVNAGLARPPAALDRSTPRRAWSALLGYCDAENWELAAHLLNLGDIEPADQRAVGAAVVRKLCEVLKQTDQRSAEGMVDTPLGPLHEDRPANYAVPAQIELRTGTEQVWLRRTKDRASKAELWLVTRRTVSLVPAWYREIVRGERESSALAVVNEGLGRIPSDLDLSTPKAAAALFVELTGGGDYQGAARLLDLRAVEPSRQAEEGRRLARRLALILGRIRSGGFGRLSNDELGAPERDVPDDEEVIARSQLGGAETQLRLKRYRREDGSQVWLFSSDTVEDVDQLYRHTGYGWAGDYLPPVFFRVSLWQVQLWQGIALLVGALLSWIAGIFLGFFTRKGALKLARMTKWDWDDRVVDATKGPLKLIYFAVGMLVVSGLVALAAGPQAVVLRICKLFTVLGIGWFFVRVVDVAADILHDLFKKREDEMGMAMVPVARRIFKPIMILLVLIFALQNAGMNVAGLLAGLGIGGLALAMASKTTVENMLGGITIAFDRPFRVNDFIRVGDLLGTVEEVGLRSTRIRTLDRTLVTIPNGQMVDSRVENFAKRDRIRLLMTIGVQYDTSREQLQFIIDEINRVLLAHPMVYHEVIRVRFAGFADSALEVEIVTFITTTDYTEFTAVREALMLEISRVVEAAGAEFAFPSRTIYTGKAADADSRKAKAAAEVMEQRVAAGDWTIPTIPDELRERLSPKEGQS
jgi:MscS family membrane protein